MRSVDPSNPPTRVPGTQDPAPRPTRETSRIGGVADAAVPWFAALLLGGCGGGCGGALENGEAEEPTEEAGEVTPEEAPGEEASLPRAGLFRRGADALVRLETPHRIGGGFIAEADGIVVTRYALVEDERVARVVLGDGRTLEVERVLAAEPARDLAVLAVAASDLPTLEIASTPAVGRPVFALGHGLGMVSPTLAEGVVKPAPAEGELAFVASDTVPTGFAGAPVLDPQGRVVGVVTGDPGKETTITSGAEITELLEDVKPNGGETMAEFGSRTRRAKGVTDAVNPLDGKALSDCSGKSQEMIWLELGRSLEMAAVMDAVGVPEAAFRLMEGAVLRLDTDLKDCEQLMGVLVSSIDMGRASATAYPALHVIAGTFEDALELLFETSPEGKQPIQPTPHRPPSSAPTV